MEHTAQGPPMHSVIVQPPEKTLRKEECIEWQGRAVAHQLLLLLIGRDHGVLLLGPDVLR